MPRTRHRTRPCSTRRAISVQYVLVSDTFGSLIIPGSRVRAPPAPPLGRVRPHRHTVGYRPSCRVPSSRRTLQRHPGRRRDLKSTPACCRRQLARYAHSPRVDTRASPTDRTRCGTSPDNFPGHDGRRGLAARRAQANRGQRVVHRSTGRKRRERWQPARLGDLCKVAPTLGARWAQPKGFSTARSVMAS